MMNVEFDEQNGILKCPEGMENCYDLPYHAGYDIQNPANLIPTVTACWKLNSEEIAELNTTGNLYITFYGRTISPVMPMVENPFKLGIIGNDISKQG